MSACDSATANVAVEVVVRFGKDPPVPAPDQVTVQFTSAATGYAFPGLPCDVWWYVCPQSGDADRGSAPDGKGVPAPGHVTVDPSPIDHVTEFGTAVAVTETPGTDAVADRGRHCAGSIHNQVGKLTNCVSAGEA